MSTTYTDLTLTNFPDSIDNFITKLDITTIDAPTVKLYLEAVKNGNTELAQQYFNLIPNAPQKILTAQDINKVTQALVALERFYTEEYEDELSSNQSAWSTKVNQFSFKGTYSTTTTYVKNNYVLYNGFLYVGITETIPVGTLPTNTSYWRVFTVKGDIGELGESLAFDGTWDSATLYLVNTCVVYNGALYQCIVQNTNQNPASATSYWSLVSRIPQYAIPFSTYEPSLKTEGDLWFRLVTT